MDWTEGRKRAFITATLRGGMRRWPPKWQALADAYIETTINPKTKRKAKMYRCAGCFGAFSTSDVQVDHVDPVVDPAVGFVSWDVFIERLYCGAENLQVLCTECHKEKTKRERAVSTLHKVQKRKDDTRNVGGQEAQEWPEQLVQGVQKRVSKTVASKKSRKGSRTSPK